MRGKAKRDGRPRGALKLRRYSLLFVDQSTPDLTQFYRDTAVCNAVFQLTEIFAHDTSENTLTLANFRILISKKMLGDICPRLGVH